MSETQKMDVIVNKSVNLLPGETLSEFTSAIHVAAREHVRQKLNLSQRHFSRDAEWSAWVTEIFSQSVVAAVYNYKDRASNTRYYAFSFSRDAKTKKFTFGDTTEVERFTGFRAKPATAMVTKNHVGIQKRGGDGAFAVTEIHALKSADGALWAPSKARALGLKSR